MSKQPMSRRRFLTYTFGATAGFLGAGMLFPMVRYAVDPMLKKEKADNFIDVNMPVSEITDTPKAVQFILHRNDGWYHPPKGETMTAWVLMVKGKILALSPECKHLGCTVNWDSNPKFKGQFFCPCHFGRYTKDGINIPGTPPSAPLDRYKTMVKNGKLFLGPKEKV